jgi:glycosyltransferase involved in cell wall biosynthesis
MVKVAHFIATLDIGGAEKQLLTLCTEQSKHGYEVVVFPLKGSNSLAKSFEYNGIKIDNRLMVKGSLRQLFGFISVIFECRGYIFHAHSAKAQLFLSILPKYFRRQLIFSKHDSMRFIRRGPKLVSSVLSRWVQYRCARFITISNSIVTVMEAEGYLFDKNKTTTSYYGISQEEKEVIQGSNRDGVRSQWKVNKRTFVIGTVGRLIEEKNHMFLINAFEQFLKDFPNAYLVICGYGPLEIKIRSAIEERNLGMKIKLLTREPDVKQLYLGFDLFVLPSKTEGFGLVLLEAMAAHLPIIASEVGSIPEVLGEKHPGMFAPNDQAQLETLLLKSTNARFRRNLVDISNSRVIKFTSDNMFRGVEGIYRKL